MGPGNLRREPLSSLPRFRFSALARSGLRRPSSAPRPFPGCFWRGPPSAAPGSPVTRQSAGQLSCFSGELAPVSLLPSRLPPRRPSGWQDAASQRLERVPGTPPGGYFAAYPFPLRGGARPRRTHSRPGRRAALPPAPSSHPTLSRPRHLTPPPSPAAPRTPRPGPASRSLCQTAHLPALRPREEETFPGAHSSALTTPALALSPAPPPRLFLSWGRGAVASD